MINAGSGYDTFFVTHDTEVRADPRVAIDPPLPDTGGLAPVGLLSPVSLAPVDTSYALQLTLALAGR